VDEPWAAERRRVTGSFDRIADLYRETFAAELEGKPFDRQLLADLAAALRRSGRDGPVLEVGAGSAPVAPRLAERGLRVLASDASLGQLRECRVVDPGRPLAAADARQVPVRPGSLVAIVAFYCLIYGPAEHLDGVFADWHRALIPGGLVVIAVHAGDGVLTSDEWKGRPIDIAIVLRDPDDLVARLQAAGFAIDLWTVRPPYAQEHQTDRLYVVAEAATAGRRAAGRRHQGGG
jgi:SAM-dependent methyltransferase